MLHFARLCIIHRRSRIVPDSGEAAQAHSFSSGRPGRPTGRGRTAGYRSEHWTGHDRGRACRTDRCSYCCNRHRRDAPPSASQTNQSSERRHAVRLPGIDQVLSTRDVECITGRHRCTIYRWVCAGTFPPRRAGRGRGWLRSDVERWLSSGRVGAQQDSVTPGGAPRATL